MANSTRTFAVIGLGNFGGTVAKELVRFGNYVIGIDRDERIVSDFAEVLSHAVIVDSRDDAALREAGVGDCDVGLIAMGEDLESSVLSAMNLKLIGVGQVWAKAVSRTHHRILSRLGVDRVIHPEEDMGRHIAQMLHTPFVRDYVSLGNSFHVVNFALPERLEGTTLADLKLARRDLRCVGVMRGTEWLGDGLSCAQQLKPDDRILLLGRRADLRDFTSAI
ncbi:potassium transporter KtrA [Pacificitalea manganoxidans]|uniref:Potassium transporter KtrA n=1 Tax=Pacificitalea manganoxidans TaxID=1411902 RepID=A0A291LZU3_9RHOB|nr:TrkA family potassium uptake protein [Pacificitalea manganoxidans]ATI42174.1 potassium transporter KtrA [Pacificitalea manganoxidans]MAQ46032.1 TrkA family potassium uptake protein [Actibacterium sp.]MDR6308020.1 trk system potassium uptake protein TrkA [Pacificitalea manganoxidans]OWU68444.1 potassium transporter KtrA [Roseovarius sp. 22II1-1F6A]|tara:strand:- start:43 stop:705 length:663 start_codon:yes stop_codon:yes gene_type:complete